MVSFIEHSTPYNGTKFTLSGVVYMEQSVDTNITIDGLWSTSSCLGLWSCSQEVTTMQHQIDLLFQPLSGDSSGEYTLTVNVKPSVNSEYIVESSNSTTYYLTVQGKVIL